MNKPPHLRVRRSVYYIAIGRIEKQMSVREVYDKITA